MMVERVQRREGRAANVIGDARRFIGAGIFNTLLTLAIYQLLLFIVSPAIAYAAAWVVGVCIVALIYPSKVFKGGDATISARGLTAGIYVISFFLGVATVTFLDTVLGIERFAVFGALVVTTLINFVLMSIVLRGRSALEAVDAPEDHPSRSV